MERSHLFLIVIISLLFIGNIHTQQNNQESPITITNVNLYSVSNGTDMFVDIEYNYNFTGEERITEEKLHLSLDNDTFILAIDRLYDPNLMNATGSSGFFFANSVGDPLPFDVQKGQTLYGYIEVISTERTYKTPTFAELIPVTVIRSILFKIPGPIFIIGGIALSLLPVAIIAYLIVKKKNTTN